MFLPPQLKQQQSEILQFLDAKKIQYKTKDITQDPSIKDEMRKLVGNPSAMPPQVFSGDTYCGVSPPSDHTTAQYVLLRQIHAVATQSFCIDVNRPPQSLSIQSCMTHPRILYTVYFQYCYLATTRSGVRVSFVERCQGRGWPSYNVISNPHKKLHKCYLQSSVEDQVFTLFII